MTLFTTKGEDFYLMSDAEDEDRYDYAEHKETKSMGVDVFALKRKQLLQDYRPYVTQEKIAEVATGIYFTVMNGITLKRGKRKAMMAKCAYEAYNKNNIPKDPILLAYKFEVDKKQFMKAQNIFYEQLFRLGKMSEFPKLNLSAKQLLPDIAKYFGFENLPIESMGDAIDHMYTNSVFISRWSPRDVAIVTLLWYIECVKSVNDNGAIVTKTEVKQKATIAETKIKQMMPMIKAITSK